MKALPAPSSSQLRCSRRFAGTRTSKGCRVVVRAAASGPVELPSGAVWCSHAQPASAEVNSASFAAAGGGAATWGSGGALELPGGALWWQHLRNSGRTPLYGTNFVLQRATVGGQGLVKSVQPPKPVAPAKGQPGTTPTVWHAPGGGGGLTLAGSSLGGCVVIDTDFVLLPPQDHSAVQPNKSCVGLVWMGASDEAVAEAEHPTRRKSKSKHPRRTQMLRFTCNLCHEVSDCEVNPHAWERGSVFARCQGCTVVHKLKDNLRIFHELAGPVFPPPELRSTYLIQEILDKIQERNRN